MKKRNIFTYPTLLQTGLLSILFYLLFYVAFSMSLKPGLKLETSFLLLLAPVSFFYTCGYYFALNLVKQLMNKKIFVAGKSPMNFFFKKLNFIIFPYWFSCFAAFLGFLGPSYYMAYKIFKN